MIDDVEVSLRDYVVDAFNLARKASGLVVVTFAPCVRDTSTPANDIPLLNFNQLNIMSFQHEAACSDTTLWPNPHSLTPADESMVLISIHFVCNGNLHHKGSVALDYTYTAASNQVGARIFWALVVLNNYVIVGIDATNVFVEAPEPALKVPLYVVVDAPLQDW